MNKTQVEYGLKGNVVSVSGWRYLSIVVVLRFQLFVEGMMFLFICAM